MFTIDASVWVNAYSPAEPGSNESNQFLEKLFVDQLPVILPTLLVVEIAGAIRRTRGDFELANEIASGMLELPTSSGFSLMTLCAARGGIGCGICATRR